MSKNNYEIDKKLLHMLSTVQDPELGISIVKMGLIYGIVRKNNTIHVTMTLTTIGCPLFDYIKNDIIHTLQEKTHCNDISVEVTFDPPWTPAMMSDDAKLDVGFI